MDLPRFDLNWAYIIPILLVLVLIHEWGHFITARKVGIKVEEFGFGLPPRLFGFVLDGVLYSINALPFGGFVRMLGEDGATYLLRHDSASDRWELTMYEAPPR